MFASSEVLGTSAVMCVSLGQRPFHMSMAQDLAVMANLLQRCRSWNIHRIRGVKEKCFKTGKRKTGVCEWTNGIRFPVRASYLTWSH